MINTTILTSLVDQLVRKFHRHWHIELPRKINRLEATPKGRKIQLKALWRHRMQRPGQNPCLSESWRYGHRLADLPTATQSRSLAPWRRAHAILSAITALPLGPMYGNHVRDKTFSSVPSNQTPGECQCQKRHKLVHAVKELGDTQGRNHGFSGNHEVFLWPNASSHSQPSSPAFLSQQR